MKKAKAAVLIILLIPIVIVLLNKGGSCSKISDTILFKNKLSDYGLFKGRMSDLRPNDNVLTAHLSATLFTDYTEKQRLIVLPPGKMIRLAGDGVPTYPEGTIIAKTFYYSKGLKGGKPAKIIVETRLLIKHKSQWNASSYLWKGEEAYLSPTGGPVAVSFIDGGGSKHTTNYIVPSRTDCITCHRQGDALQPIGLTAKNMNLAIDNGDVFTNQLDYWKHIGRLEYTAGRNTARSVPYDDPKASLEDRARSYLNINCAHCHNPGGIAAITQLDLREETPLYDTGLLLKQGKVALRMTVPGELHMPKIGTTIPHKEGIALVLQYINSLNKRDTKKT